MTAPKRLRVINPDEKPPVKPLGPMSITKAADEGTRHDYLVALRARLSKALDNPDTPPRDLAALMRRAEQIDGEIRSIETATRDEDGEVDTPDAAWSSEAL